MIEIELSAATRTLLLVELEGRLVGLKGMLFGLKGKVVRLKGMLMGLKGMLMRLKGTHHLLFEAEGHSSSAF